MNVLLCGRLQGSAEGFAGKRRCADWTEMSLLRANHRGGNTTTLYRC